MPEEEFYNKIAELLGTQHVYVQPVTYMRRWGKRTPGNGRFPGHGVIRVHASDRIHFAFYTPAFSKTFKSFDEALVGLSGILTQEPQKAILLNLTTCVAEVVPTSFGRAPCRGGRKVVGNAREKSRTQGLRPLGPFQGRWYPEQLAPRTYDPPRDTPRNPGVVEPG